MIRVENLYKTYKEKTAVCGISFHVKEGVCFGLLGPNGAGKTTTLEILEGVKTPTKGEILFRGRPRDHSYKEKIGVQFQSTALQDYMRVIEALKTFASFYKNPQPISKVIEMCGLEDIAHYDQGLLSGGQRKRLLLALSLINDPDLIFLDEPTTGLDPVSRQSFWELTSSLKKHGKTIILTTHYMDEARSLCDEIVLIDGGKILQQGTPETLLREYFEGVRVLFPLSQKKHFNGSFSTPPTQTNSHIEFKTKNVQALLGELTSKNISLNQIEIRPYTLDDLFLHLTGKVFNKYDGVKPR